MIKRERASILSPGYDKFEKIHRLVREGQDDEYDVAVAEVTSMKSYEGWLIRNLGLNLARSALGEIFRMRSTRLASAALRHSLIVSIQPFYNKCENTAV